MRHATILLAVVVMLAVPVNAATWTGATSTAYGNSANWEGGTMPDWDSEGAVFGSSGNNCLITLDAEAYNVMMDGTDHVTLQSGTWHVGNGDEFYLGYQVDQTGNPSLFTQTGGTLDSDRVIHIGYTQSSTAGLGYGKYVISGGSLDVADDRYIMLGYVYSGSYKAKGIFRVVGSGPTSISTGGFYINSDLSILELAFDGDNDPIQQIDVTGDIVLKGNLVITGTSGAAGPVTIMTYGGTLTGEFDSVTDGWTVDYGVTTSGVITVIPEPATLSLLAVGAVALMLIRRKRN